MAIRKRIGAKVKRAGAKPSFKVAAGQASGLEIRTAEGEVLTVASPANLPGLAMFWAYVVRNRFRWSTTPKATDFIYGMATELFETSADGLGLGREGLKTIASAGIVEVSVPYSVEEEGWEHRVLPWEFVLSAATRQFRRSPLTVVRSLRLAEKTGKQRSDFSKLLFVESAPGELADQIVAFDSEKRLVQHGLGLSDQDFETLRDPTCENLRDKIKQGNPSIVHLSGLDVHEAHWRMKGEWGDGDKPQWLQKSDCLIQDGYMMCGDDGRSMCVGQKDLPATFRVASPPRLVCFSIFHSAARLAALAVAEGGVEAAIGIQDEIKDAITEAFYTDFYFALRHLEGNVLEAFRSALELQSSQVVDLRGAGLVLWTRDSLLSKLLPTGRAISTIQQARESATRDVAPEKLEERDGAALYEISVNPEREINYSLLQNQRALFSEFRIRNRKHGWIRDLLVEVNLHVGGEECKWSELINRDKPVVELRGEIALPLTAQLLRSLREAVQSVIRVTVCLDGKAFYNKTWAVKLIAIEEWKDQWTLNVFLPSFVLPEDPAVQRVIDGARPYLVSLSDDANAGFDGYQQVEESKWDTTEVVDWQVQAIWSSLTLNHTLHYINPPATFTKNSQRLRLPSRVMDGRWGTCIDLTLLLASCLEAVEIYPCLFLLSGHAFPGYWRSEQRREEFLQFQLLRKNIAKSRERLLREGGHIPVGRIPTEPWAFYDHREVAEVVRSGDLVPLESVWLTQRSGFWDAVEAGVENLRSQSEFEALFDVRGAREGGVTPLPVLRGGA